jgi:hypothetical protein
MAQTFVEGVEKAIEVAVVNEVKRVAEEYQKRAHTDLDIALDGIIAQVGINVARMVEYSVHSDRIVITLVKKTD